MKKLFIFFTFALIALANPLEFKSISSKFKQTIINEENKKIVYTGSFYATSNQKALWIYKTPINKKIYFNQKKVVILEPELEQAIITNLQQSPNITDILKNAKKTTQDEYMTLFDDVEYKVHVKNELIDKITYKDKLENSVEIQLLEVVTNAFLDDVLFQVTIPQDYDIITQ